MSPRPAGFLARPHARGESRHRVCRRRPARQTHRRHGTTSDRSAGLKQAVSDQSTIREARPAFGGAQPIISERTAGVLHESRETRRGVTAWLRLVASIIVNLIVALLWTAILAWLVGRVLTDRFAWSQWLWWIPTPAMIIVAVLGLLFANRTAHATRAQPPRCRMERVRLGADDPLRVHRTSSITERAATAFESRLAVDRSLEHDAGQLFTGRPADAACG